MKSENRTFTYQTRLSLDDNQETILVKYAQLMSVIERSLFADLAKGKKIGELKSPYLLKHGITARQFNAIRTQVEGKIASIKELRKEQIKETKGRRTSLLNTIEKLSKKKGRAFEIHQKRRRLDRIDSKIQALEADAVSGKIRLCFGSRRLFRSQFNLKANGYDSHKEWCQDWQDARNNSFFIIGSKDESGGNQSCIATQQPDGSLSLKLRLPNALEQHGKYLSIDNVHFKYGHEAIIRGLERGKERKLLKNNDLGVAINYRYRKDENGWILFVSLSIPEPAVMIHEGIGVLGIDINVDHLSVVETDRYGNPIKRKKIPLHLYGKNQNQTKALIGDASVEIVKWSLEAKKPIVLEQLSFQEKKTDLHECGNAKYSRMLSSFSYHAILSSIKSRAWRLGVKVKEVNPAFTSLIGRVKFAKRYGLSIHESAALSIGRRFLGSSERLPRRSSQMPDGKGGYVTLSLPARKRDRHVWASWRVVKRKLPVVLAAHFRAIKSRSLDQ